MSELITPALIVTAISLSIAGTGAFCLFERIVAVLQPVLVVCGNAPVGVAIESMPGRSSELAALESSGQNQQTNTQ